MFVINRMISTVQTLRITHRVTNCPHATNRIV